MNQPAIFTDTTATMTSREIAELTGKQHKHVMRDVQTHIESGALNESNLGLVDYVDGKGERRPMYQLDFEATMIVVTGYDAMRRAAVIRRWKALEEGTATPAFQIPTNLADALQLAADQARENEKLQLQIESDRPKIIFADAVEASKTSILIGDLAKLMHQNGVNIGQHRLFDWMRKHGWLIKHGESRNMPTQKAVDMGLLDVKVRTIVNADGSIRTTKTTKVTGKGQQYFINLFLKKAVA